MAFLKLFEVILILSFSQSVAKLDSIKFAERLQAQKTLKANMPFSALSLYRVSSESESVEACYQSEKILLDFEPILWDAVLSGWIDDESEIDGLPYIKDSRCEPFLRKEGLNNAILKRMKLMRERGFFFGYSNGHPIPETHVVSIQTLRFVYRGLSCPIFCLGKFDIDAVRAEWQAKKSCFNR